MANHKSALKRIRSSETKRLRNRYQFKTTRNAIKKLKDATNKKEAEKQTRLEEEEYAWVPAPYLLSTFLWTGDRWVRERIGRGEGGGGDEGEGMEWLGEKEE